MQIRKNTKAHKSILRIVEDSLGRPDREKHIRLYITRAGHTVKERISIEGVEGESDLLYDMTYQTVLNNLKSSNHQLHHSEELPGLYYFHSSSNKEWDETPFEFDEAVLKLFPDLPEPPTTRKKGKVEKYTLPTAPKTAAKTAKKPQKKSSEKKRSPAKKEEKQPNYRLKHKITFTALGTVVFRRPPTSRRDIFDYYDKVADRLLPYLKDRPVTLLRPAGDGRVREYTTASSLTDDKLALPGWIKTTGKNNEQLLLCNDRDHLFFYLEAGVVAFAPRLATIKYPDRADYFIVTLGDNTEWARVAEAAQAMKTILDGLKLPSTIKTDGASGLHVDVPLDGKRDFQTAHDAAGFICRLLKLKAPDLIALSDGDNGYRKVLVDYSLNEKTGAALAPYSLAGTHPGVAVPLSWNDIKPDLQSDQFTLESIMKAGRISPPKQSTSGKADARALLDRLTTQYGFLLT
ncbi:MAG TPA: hypothetical protein VKZ86_06040 [Cyclobacteriaceae bacterium]|nr:hypothetical protein [Cyclobacteriaceae bacterium]